MLRTENNLLSFHFSHVWFLETTEANGHVYLTEAKKFVSPIFMLGISFLYPIKELFWGK